MSEENEQGVQASRSDVQDATASKTVAKTKQRQKFTNREKVLIAVSCVACILAVIGFALFVSEYVPSSVAAKVEGEYSFNVNESEVNSWITQYRASNSLTEDSDFASALLSQDQNVQTFREDAINQLALQTIINKKAADLNVVPTDEQVQEHINAMKDSYAFGDDDIWTETLQSYGLSEDSLKEQYRTNLAKQAVFEQCVEKQDATIDDVLNYMKNYLATSTQKHAYRIMFTGDNASERANTCLAEINQLRENGELNVESFSKLAKANSDEDGVATSGGSFAWSGSGMSDEIKDIIEDMNVGECSGAESIDEDGAVEIFFIDADYTFPSSSELGELPSDIPDALMAEIQDAAADYAWEDDCDAYLTYLLSSAKITYYPVPDNASYNVDMALASVSSGSVDEEGSLDDLSTDNLEDLTNDDAQNNN